MAALSICTLAAFAGRPAPALTEVTVPPSSADPSMCAKRDVPVMATPLFGAPVGQVDMAVALNGAVGLPTVGSSLIAEPRLQENAASGAAAVGLIGALSTATGALPKVDSDLFARAQPGAIATPRPGSSLTDAERIPSSSATIASTLTSTEPSVGARPASVFAPQPNPPSRETAPAFAQSEAHAAPQGDATRYLAKSSSALPAPKFGLPAQEVGDDVLADQRGGFSINGVDVTLGAQIETFIDGQLSLVTTVNWTESSATTTQTVSGLLTPASAAELQNGLLNTGHISMNVGNASVYLANGGQTAVIHNTTAGIQDVLVNTASNTNINTQVTATIGLSDYAAYQNNFRIGALGASIGQAMGAATLGAVMN